jgi:Do/DeqQ family serine protease
MILKTLSAAALALALATTASAQSADNRRVPSDAIAMKSSFAPIVRGTAPAVVNVFSARRVQQQVDPFFAMFYGGAIPKERIEQSLGSGAIVRADGIVVTNHHVVENMTEIRVVLNDRREFPATILLDDARADLAVLKIDPGAEKLPVLPITTRDDLEVGDLVLAIGNPFGVGQTVTNGIVSALARTDTTTSDFSFFIQTDAAINPGNSGGPLVDMDGKLVGLNTAIFSKTGSTAGIGFAIPAAMVRQVVETAEGGRKSVERPWLGARTQVLTSAMAEGLGLASPRGVLIDKIWRGGPADRAGLKEGDLLLSVDGAVVNDVASVNYRVGTRHAGDAVALRYSRAGKDADARAMVEAPPRLPAPDETVLTGAGPLVGVKVANLSPGYAAEKGVDPFITGVVIVELPQQTAYRTGLRPGDIVVELNGTKIDTPRRLQGVTTAGARRWALTINRGGQTVSATF